MGSGRGGSESCSDFPEDTQPAGGREPSVAVFSGKFSGLVSIPWGTAESRTTDRAAQGLWASAQGQVRGARLSFPSLKLCWRLLTEHTDAPPEPANEKALAATDVPACFPAPRGKPQGCEALQERA